MNLIYAAKEYTILKNIANVKHGWKNGRLNFAERVIFEVDSLCARYASII